jgi:hypothetical protein
MDTDAAEQHHRPSAAARRLDALGAPRSVHTLRVDHRRPSGERGPRYLRDAQGHTWYRDADLRTWAATQVAARRYDAPPPPQPTHLRAAAGTAK